VQESAVGGDGAAVGFENEAPFGQKVNIPSDGYPGHGKMLRQLIRMRLFSFIDELQNFFLPFKLEHENSP
jgi:hypothetical protein